MSPSEARNGRNWFWRWVVGIFASAALLASGALWNQVTAKFNFYDTLVESRNVRTSNVEARVSALESAFLAQNEATKQRLGRIERKIDDLPERMR